MFWPLVLIVFSATLVWAQPAIDKDIISAQNALTQAFARGDAAAWAQLTVEDWIRINPDGSVVNRQQQIEIVKKGISQGQPLPRAPHESAQYQLRIYGETAIQTWVVTEGDDVRVTRVWARRNGRWQQVHLQVTPITSK